jgi:hypothetical protein
MKYLIDYSGWFREGGYCQFYPIKNHKNLGFKEFRSKNKAQYALSTQKKLAKFDLAPKVYSAVCTLSFAPEDDTWLPDSSDWGYVTEIAREGKEKFVPLKDIQELVNSIREKTGLKFWDCHWFNVGLVKRSGKNKLVCIDTGKESFDGLSNAWGFSDPGPKCNYCDKYQCRCSEY